MERELKWHVHAFWCITLLLTWTLGGSTCWASETDSLGVHVYNGEAYSGYLGKKLSILEDKTGKLGIDEVLRSDSFKVGTSEIPDLGLTASVYWAKLELTNLSGSSELFLHIAHSEIDQLDIYDVPPDAMPKQIVHAGLDRRVNKNDQPYPELAFLVDVPSKSSTALYFRLTGDKPLRLPLTVESRSAFNKSQQGRTIFIGGYLGIMLVMALYNLFIFLFTRERSYAIYVAYIVLVTLTQMAFFGMLSYSVFKDMPWLSVHSPLYLTVFTAMAAGEFMVSFIHVKEKFPSAIRVKNGLYLLLVAGLVLDLLGLSTLAYQLLQAGALSFALFQLTVTVRIAALGFRPARYFLVAWSVFLIGIVVFILKDVGVLPYNDLTRFAMTIGSAVEVVLLSFGLADKINVLRREKEQIILEQYAVLELRVTERTQELELSNSDLKRTQSQLVNAEKMAALGQLTAGIAHEINNPINFISSSIPPLKRDLSDLREVLMAYRDARINGRDLEEVRLLEDRIDLEFNMKEVDEILLNLESGAQRTSEIVRGLRTFSRLDEYELKTVDVNEGIKSTLVVLAPQVRDAVAIELDLGQLPLVECYAGKLNQVFMNLLNNAIFAVKQKHGAAGGKVRVVSYHTGEHAIFEIHDNGTGMDEATQHRLFEPFFTTKDVGEGTGLGMSIALSIIEDHNGTITVQSSPGEGSIFTLTLPISQQLLHAKRA
jgi:two-component system, NtrC family, sensor kinase